MAEIKERPILFSATMVRALLDGRKTQTRRVIKPQPDLVSSDGFPAIFTPDDQKHGRLGKIINCPYGKAGDRLWVREKWMPDAPRDGSWADVEFYGCRNAPFSLIPKRYQKSKHCLFRATWNGDELTGWKPSIHMPRWASRINLEITGIRVERLQDISESDAIAEGVELFQVSETDHRFIDYQNPDSPGFGRAVDSYESLWYSINGADSWAANPWVWVIEFKRISDGH